MNFSENRSRNLNRIAIAGAVALATLAPLAASAQTIDLGLAYVQSAGLPLLDVRDIAVSLIRLALGFAGFLLVLQILKGGFHLMTMGYLSEAREEAIETIKSAVIGFVLISISSSLTNYIVRTVADAAGMVINNYL